MARDLLKRFYLLQEERIQTYKLFEEGFQGYLKGKPNYNFPLYRQLVHEITETFRKISKDIISMKEEFAKTYNLNLIAECLDKIQEHEKQKLKLVAQLQMARQNEADHPEDMTFADEIKDFKQKLKQTENQICLVMEDLKYESEDLYQ